MSEQKEVGLPELRTPERAAMLIAAQDEQITALMRQVEQNARDASWARTNRPKLADCEDALRKAEAELAALREGKVYYRPYGEIGKYLNAGDVRKDCPGYKVVEIRERILDTTEGKESK
jgi:hypothetical protein